MLEIAQNFEQMALRLDSIVLVGLGLAAVLLGLFVWLGGLGFRRPLLAVVGVVAGGICGYFITGRGIISVMVWAAVAAVIAIAFERTFITILAAGLAAFCGLAALAKSYTGNSYSFKQACLQMPACNWVIIAALVVIFIAAGFFLWRLTSALCCAALGTMLVFAGMILLLLYKGTSPVSYIGRKPLFYLGVFAAMTAFGTIEQLLLCQRIKEKLVRIRKRETNRNKEEPGEKSLDWRTK